MKTMKISGLALLGVTGVLLSGCQSRSEAAFSPVGNLTDKLKKEFAATAVPPPLAGTAREAKPHTNAEIVAASGLTFMQRTNPFSLFGEEMAFENSIRYRIILGKMVPTYTLELEEPAGRMVPEAIPLEVQPYRRVAGLYFGDTIRALVIMEDGKSYFVSPGDRLGEWTVIAVTQDEIVLRRENKIPREVRVRLEAAPPGMMPGGGGGTQPGGGQPGTVPGGGDGGGGGGRTGEPRSG